MVSLRLPRNCFFCVLITWIIWNNCGTNGKSIEHGLLPGPSAGLRQLDSKYKGEKRWRKFWKRACLTKNIGNKSITYLEAQTLQTFKSCRKKNKLSFLFLFYEFFKLYNIARGNSRQPPLMPRLDKAGQSYNSKPSYAAFCQL